MSTLVTGADNGLGRLAALRAAAAGQAVAAVDLEADSTAATATRSPTTRSYQCDVTDADEVARVVERATEQLGPVDHVLHAAGLCEVGPVLEQPIDSVRRVMEVNYFGSVHLARAILPGMLSANAGTLVLFASLSGWVPSPALGAYSASKAAVISFGEVLAQEIAEGQVRLLCVCPGQVETRLAQRVRAVDPGILGGQCGADPADVLDAVDRALDDPARPQFLFPTRWDRAIRRARRFAPSALRRQIVSHVQHRPPA